MRSTSETYSAAVLAGGESRRFGQDKGLAVFRGKALVEHVIFVLRKLANDVFIISNNSVYQDFGTPVFNDNFNTAGPLGGLEAALANATHSHCFCVACDMPFLTPALFHAMQQHANHEAVVPVFRGMAEPLAALYQKSALATVHKQLELQQFKMTDTIMQLNHHWLEVDENCEFYHPHMFANINTREEWERLQ